MRDTSCLIFEKWRKADYILVLTVVSVGAIVTFYGVSASADPETAKDTRRYPLAQLLLFSSPVITVFAIIAIKIKIDTTKLGIIFCALFIIPIIILLIILFSKGIEYATLIGLILLSIAGILFLTLRLLYKLPFNLGMGGLIRISLSSTRSDLGPFLAGTFCIWGPLLMICTPVYLYLVNQIIKSEVVSEVAILWSIGGGIVILSPWIFFHYKYFVVENDVLLDKIFPENSPTIQTYIKLSKWVPSVLVGLTMTGCIVYCLTNLILNINNFSSSLVIFSMMIIVIPIFIYGGLGITRSDISNEYKLYIIGALFGILPLGTFIPLYFYFTEYQYFIKFLIGLAFFAVAVLGIISMLSEFKIVYNSIFMIMCITIAFPIGFIYPLLSSDIINPILGYIIIGLLGLILCIILIYGFYGLIKFLLSKRVNLGERIENDERTSFIEKICYYSCHYFLMVLFVVTESILIYVYCDGSSQTFALGAVMGMIALLPFIYCFSAVTLQLPVESKDFLRNNDLKQKTLILSFFILITVLPTCIIFIFTLSFLGEIFTAVMKSLAVGISLLFLLLLLFLTIKYKMPKNSKVIMMLLNIFMWIFLIIPLCIVLPISLTKAESTRTIYKYIGITILYLGMLTMSTVTILAILYNRRKKKMDEEKLAKECCKFAIEELGKKWVKCDKKVIRRIYSQFSYLKFEEDYLSKLTQGKDFMLNPINRNSQEKFNQILINVKKQSNKDSQSKSSQNEGKPTKKVLSFWVFLRCFENYPYETNIKANPTHKSNKKLNGLHILDLEKIEVNPQSELHKISPPIKNQRIINIFNSEFQGSPDIIDSNLRDFQYTIQNSIILSEMKIDRTARVNWMESVFNFITTKESTSIFKQPWLSENTLLLFCRYGGIHSNKISDNELRMIYADLTELRVTRKITCKVFIDELIPLLAKKIYNLNDPVLREITFVTELLYPNIKKNFDKIMTNTERSYTIQLTKSQSKNRYSGIDSNMTFHDMSKSDINYDNYSPKNSNKKGLAKCLSDFFDKLGSKIVYYGRNIGESTEKELFKFYTPSAKKKDIKQELKFEDLSNQEKFIEWEEVCKLVLETITKKRKEKKSKEEKDNKDPETISFYYSNVSAIIGKLLEIFQLSAMSFKSDVNWYIIGSYLETPSNIGTVENNPYTLYLFWIVFLVTCAYGIIVYKSLKKINRGEFGKDKDGKPLNFFTWESFNKKLLDSLGSVMYISILKSQLNLFSCNINVSPPVVWKTDIECYSSFHIGMICASIISLGIYYPAATFTFPTLQFFNDNFDLKTHESYLIILSQAKLLIAGITVFLPFQLYLQYQLIIFSIIILLLFIYTITVESSVNKRFNLWCCFGYVCAFLCNLFGFINMQFNEKEIIFYILLGMILISFITTLLIYIKRYGCCRPVKIESEKSEMLKNERLGLITKKETQDQTLKKE